MRKMIKKLQSQARQVMAELRAGLTFLIRHWRWERSRSSRNWNINTHRGKLSQDSQSQSQNQSQSQPRQEQWQTWQPSTSSLSIKQLADIYRELLLSEMLPAHFARQCIEFDQEIVPDSCCDVEGDLGEGDEQTCRVIGVLNQLARVGVGISTELMTGIVSFRQHQLALIWLSGHDYGHVTLAELEEELGRLRQVQMHQMALGQSQRETQADPPPGARTTLELEIELEAEMPSDEGERDWENW